MLSSIEKPVNNKNIPYAQNCRFATGGHPVREDKTFQHNRITAPVSTTSIVIYENTASRFQSSICALEEQRTIGYKRRSVNHCVGPRWANDIRTLSSINAGIFDYVL